MKIRDYFWLSIGTVFYPADALALIKKKREKLSMLFVLAMLILFSVFYLLGIQFTHFPLQTVNLRTTNILTQLSLPLILIISWMVSGYAVSSIFDGSVKFKEFAVSIVCALVPYIIFAIPIALFSYILEINQFSLYSLINTFLIIWIVILMFYSYMTLNDFSFRKNIATCLLSIVVMAAMLFIAFIIYSMTIQIIQFAREVFLEIQLINV